MPSRSKTIAAGVASLMLAVATIPAHAEMEVTESTTPGMSIGKKLPDTARLKLPKGAMLRLLVRTAEGRGTRTLTGPFEGTLAEYDKKKSSWFNRFFGGSKTGSNEPITTTRSAPREQGHGPDSR